MSELGGTLVDTAAAYGESEGVVGRTLAELNTRGKMFIATKFDAGGPGPGPVPGLAPGAAGTPPPPAPARPTRCPGHRQAFNALPRRRGRPRELSSAR